MRIASLWWRLPRTATFHGLTVFRLFFETVIEEKTICMSLTPQMTGNRLGRSIVDLSLLALCIFVLSLVPLL
jgi:hypothetical protein